MDPGDIPDPQARATFDQSKLNWSELDREPHRSLLQWHRDLIRLRAQMPELRDGRMDLVDVHFDESGRWLTVTRGRVTVACNLSATRQSVSIGTTAQYRIAMASDEGVAIASSAVNLPPDSVAILVR
jgi:maltooligosyltrehalose trehalohydrolase